LGKGVIICQNRVEAEVAIKEMLIENKFAQAGNKIIIEEFLKGKEVSILAFTDGKTIYPMVSSQDHKRALDNDEGLNTGGMGTFSPSKFYTPQMAKRVFAEVIIPTIKAMENEGRLFKGVLYFGLMIDGDDIKVLEYNARFGDPETQVVLPRLKTDLIDIFEAIIDGTLDKINVEWEDNCCVCVILASGGYPEKYQKGVEITIGDNLDKDIMLFHAGTKFENGKLVTNGGRVIGVTAKADTIEQARKIAYANVEKIDFKNKHYRKDIGIKL
ncbi:MAG: phosphoribosylamine--glycine ligase, partial [Clostridia bacterium]